MFKMYQSAGRFSKPAVSTWIGTHKIDPGKLFVSEDAAMLDVCSRISEMCRIAGSICNPDVDLSATRNAKGNLTIRARNLDVSFVIRGAAS